MARLVADASQGLISLFLWSAAKIYVYCVQLCSLSSVLYNVADAVSDMSPLQHGMHALPCCNANAGLRTSDKSSPLITAAHQIYDNKLQPIQNVSCACLLETGGS